MAAKGYHQAFLQVRASVQTILQQQADPGEVVRHDHHDWYLQLFEPSVRAGIIEAKHLAGYRSWPVYIRNARHVPPAHESVRDAMPTFFDLLTRETEPAVRAVLGHFIFVYIHPYMDGNGRMARFLMNAMLASGGYPWTVIHVDDRAEYMAALDQASAEGNIQPFAHFVGRCVEAQMMAGFTTAR
jgi:Fic family protein